MRGRTRLLGLILRSVRSFHLLDGVDMETSLDDAAALLLTAVVILVSERIEDGIGQIGRNVGRKQLLSENVSNSEVSFVRGEISGPDRDFAALGTDVTDEAADELLILAELLTDHGDERLEPDEVHQLLGTAFLDIDEPTASLGIFGDLPHGLDALLEDVVVAGRGQAAWRANVVVEGPEFLDGREGADRFESVLPAQRSLVIQVPERPSLL